MATATATKPKRATKKKATKKAVKKVTKKATKTTAKVKNQDEKWTRQIVKMAARKSGVTRQQAMEKTGASYGQVLRLFTAANLKQIASAGKAKVYKV